MQQPDSGQAIIEDGALVIRVPLKNLPQVVEGAWALGSLETRWKVTDVSAFAKELCLALNEEDEQGTTTIHKMFDAAISDALDSGAEGIEEHEEHEEQDA